MPGKQEQAMPMSMRPTAPHLQGPGGGMPSGPSYPHSSHQVMMQAHHTLFISDLPLDLHSSALEQLFASTPGLKEIRLVRERGVAFVEYESEHYASNVLDQMKQSGRLQRDIAPGVKINYAKK